jgi:hypothetical protein
MQIIMYRGCAAVIAWDSFFDLDAEEQDLVVACLDHHAPPRGALLVTVGSSKGDAIGTMDGEAVYHANFSIAEYERRFREFDLNVADSVAEDPHCGGHPALLAVALELRGGACRLAAQPYHARQDDDQSFASVLHAWKGHGAQPEVRSQVTLLIPSQEP